MKQMRLAMWVAVFALLGGIAISGDMDIQALQAKLAAQEARLNDLQAKMNSKGGAAEADSILSLRKNAVVKIGGQLNTQYMYANGNVTDANGNKTRTLNWADLRITDARINFAVQVNDYFDAFFQLNLLDGPRFGGSGNQAVDDVGGVGGGSYGPGGINTGISVAQRAWVRWKNVCNSGFGLLVGRNDIVFGMGNLGGMVISGWTANNDNIMNVWGMGNITGNPTGNNFPGVTTHQGWDNSRTTQITPYWEGMGGKLRVEASFFQAQDFYDGGRYVNAAADNSWTAWNSINNGFGSMSGRITLKPIEGLTLGASVINRYANDTYLMAAQEVGGGNFTNADRMANNNTAVSFGFKWVPCFFPRLDLFAQYNHGWNEGWNKNRSSDVVTFGAGMKVTEQVRFVLQGDYLRVKQGDVNGVTFSNKTTGWAIYPAIRYTLPYGVYLEGGYRYETLTAKDNVTGNKLGSAKLHSVYGRLGFDF